MKITVDVNGKPTEITLTADNILAVKKHELKITDQIQNWFDVCRIYGKEPEEMIPYPEPQDSFEAWMNAVAVVERTINAYNEGWIADFNNSDEEKWFLRYYGDKNSGFGFADSVTYYDYARTHVGARLCFKSQSLALDFQKKFDADYIKFLIKQP